MEIAVLIVDDFPLVREGIALALGVDPAICVVGEAGSATEAVERTRELQPDVIMLDLRLPGANGTDLIERLLAVAAGARVVVVTAIEKIDTMHEVAAAGASGYITKRAAASSLRSAVITVHGGGKLFESSVERDLVSSYPQISPGEPTGAGALLTAREKQVLAFVARGESDNEVAARLSLSPRTVQNHLAAIRRKTGIRRRSELASWAIKHLP